MSLIDKLKDAQKDAMRAREKLRLGTIRLALAEVKQKEVDTRESLSDDDVIVLLTKMVKQRNDSITQFKNAERHDLVEQEQAELEVLKEFLPAPLSESELSSLIDEAVSATGAASMQEMGKVMGWLKPKVQGRADMGKLSGQIKARLNS